MMNAQIKMPLFFILTVILLSACDTVQQPSASATPSAVPSSPPTLVPSPTPTLVPTLESSPLPTSTPQPVPTSSPTPPPDQTGVFSYVASLAGLLSDPSAQMTLHAPAHGGLWIITNQQALRWDGAQWQVVLDESDEMIATVDDLGRLWVLRQDQPGISAWQDGQWTTYPDDGDWTTAYSSLAAWWTSAPGSVVDGPAGSLWMAMLRGVRFFDGEAWSLYTLEDMGFSPQEMEDVAPVYQLAIAEDGSEVWVGECYYAPLGPMGGSGVRYFNGQVWQDVTQGAEMSCVSAMHVDPQGNQWFASYDSLWRYGHQDGSWTSYFLPEDLLLGYNFSHPLQLIVDQAGDVWVAMQMCGGASCDGAANLYRVHNGEWSLVIESDYWLSSYKQLLLDGEKQAWLIWDGVVYRLAGDSLSTIFPIDVRSADVSPDGQIWLLVTQEDSIDILTLAP